MSNLKQSQTAVTRGKTAAVSVVAHRGHVSEGQTVKVAKFGLTACCTCISVLLTTLSLV